MRITPDDIIQHNTLIDEAESRAYGFISDELVNVTFDTEKQMVYIHTDDTRSGSRDSKNTICVSYSEFFTAEELRDSKINNLLN